MAGTPGMDEAKLQKVIAMRHAGAFPLARGKQGAPIPKAAIEVAYHESNFPTRSHKSAQRDDKMFP